MNISIHGLCAKFLQDLRWVFSQWPLQGHGRASPRIPPGSSEDIGESWGSCKNITQRPSRELKRSLWQDCWELIMSDLQRPVTIRAVRRAKRAERVAQVISNQHCVTTTPIRHAQSDEGVFNGCRQDIKVSTTMTAIWRARSDEGLARAQVIRLPFYDKLTWLKMYTAMSTFGFRALFSFEVAEVLTAPIFHITCKPHQAKSDVMELQGRKIADWLSRMALTRDSQTGVVTVTGGGDSFSLFFP